MLNTSVCIYCVTCCSCFSQLSLLVLLYFLYFSVFLLLLVYIKLDNSFYYQVLVEVCMFLIIFIFIILSMFVCILYFCRNYRKKYIYIKANHVVYIVSRQYGSRIYAHCQQKLFSSEHDTGGRILRVVFLAEQKRQYVKSVNSKISLLLYQFMTLLQVFLYQILCLKTHSQV